MVTLDILKDLKKKVIGCDNVLNTAAHSQWISDHNHLLPRSVCYIPTRFCSVCPLVATPVNIIDIHVHSTLSLCLLRSNNENVVPYYAVLTELHFKCIRTFILA